MSTLDSLTCPVCGGDLEDIGGERYKCLYCGKVHAKKNAEGIDDALRRVLGEKKKEETDAARRNLWDAMHEEYISSEKCLGYAYILKGLVPNDYFADFAITANATNNDAALSSFLTKSKKEDMDIYADAVLDFMLKSMTSKTCAAVSAYVERAYDPTSDEYRKYVEIYNDVAGKVYSGVFDVSLQRDAFIAYSSRDMDKAVGLCDYLEENGISCFLSSRNLMHGRRAAENYESNLETAIDSCGTFVFVSSKNSRSEGCEARSKELVYVMRREQAEHRNVNYDNIPQSGLKHRVEYLIDPYSGSSPYDRQVRSFFHDLDWAEDMEEVAYRIANHKDGVRIPAGDDVGFQPTSLPAAGNAAENRPRDVGKARTGLTSGLRQGAGRADAGAENLRLGCDYYGGRGVTKDKGKAVACWKTAAERGQTKAQCDLAFCYENGHGVERNVNEAVTWWRKAADSGDAEGQFNLGWHYEKGIGVNKDMNAAKWWYGKAVAQGHTGAQVNLGCIYFSEASSKGRNTERANGQTGALGGLNQYTGGGQSNRNNADEYKVLWKMAADKGNALAQLNLGVYYFGLGRNGYQQAANWFKAAADRGLAEAQCSLGYCYYKGYGTGRDLTKAVRLYRLSAEQGYPPAQRLLGKCYKKGRGVGKDPTEADKWLGLYKRSRTK